MNPVLLSNAELVVVDPRPDDYALLQSQPCLAQTQFHFARSGEEALRLPRMQNLEIWYVNFDLPDMTGVELLQLLRKRSPHTPVALVSEEYSESQELLARQVGATLYVSKPPQLTWLSVSTSIHEVLNQGHQIHAPPQAEPQKTSRIVS